MLEKRILLTLWKHFSDFLTDNSSIFQQEFSLKSRLFLKHDQSGHPLLSPQIIFLLFIRQFTSKLSPTQTQIVKKNIKTLSAVWHFLKDIMDELYHFVLGECP